MSGFARRLFLTMTLTLFLTASVARASPITYTFGGTLSQPVNGSDQFSGSLTYDTSLPLNPAAGQQPNIKYYTDASGGAVGGLMNLNVQLGNVSSTTLGKPVNDWMVVWHDTKTDELNFSMTYPSPSSSNTATITIGLWNDNQKSPGPFNSTDLPTTLDLSKFNMHGTISYLDYGTSNAKGIPLEIVGRITTLGTVTVPEPTGLGVFAILATGLLAARISRKRRYASVSFHKGSSMAWTRSQKS